MGEPKNVLLKKGKEDRAVSKKEPVKADRINNFKKFLRGVKSELKKVHWPNRKQLIAYTGVTLVTVAIIALLIWVVDSALSQVMQFII